MIGPDQPHPRRDERGWRMTDAPNSRSTQLGYETVRRVCGDIPDWKVAEILAVGGDLVALEEAVAWAAGDDETTPQRHLAPSSAAARFYEILAADEEFAEDESRGGG
jgi:hypothetical protein